MLRTTLLFSAVSLALALPASAETKPYDMNSFSALDASAGVTVIFEEGETQSIIAENKNGNFDKLRIENRGDTLIVSRKSSGLFRRSKENYTVRITAPAISSIDASSGSNVKATGVSGDEVELSVSSGAALEADNVTATNIALEASSGARLEAQGTCTGAELTASSGSNIRAGDLVCVNVDAGASSGASIRAHASQSVEGDASSGASIRVKGGATDIEKNRSSGGSVTVS